MEDFQEQIQTLLAAIPFDALFFNHHFGRVLEGFVSAILLGQNVVGHDFSVSFFLTLFPRLFGGFDTFDSVMLSDTSKTRLHDTKHGCLSMCKCPCQDHVVVVAVGS